MRLYKPKLPRLGSYGFYYQNNNLITAQGRPGGRTPKHSKQKTVDPISSFVNQAPIFNIDKTHQQDRGNVTGDIPEPVTTDDIAAALGLKPF